MNKKFCYARLAFIGLGASIFAITAGAADKPVPVTFNDAGCPIDVSPETIDVRKASNDRVVWNAVKSSGGDYKGGFMIVFDPFNGGSRLSTNNKARIKSPPVDNKIPPDANIKYKYSIMGRNCGDILDPNIRVL